MFSVSLGEVNNCVLLTVGHKLDYKNIHIYNHFTFFGPAVIHFTDSANKVSYLFHKAAGQKKPRLSTAFFIKFSLSISVSL